MHSQHVNTIHILGGTKMLLGKGYSYANKKLINLLTAFIYYSPKNLKLFWLFYIGFFTNNF